MVCRRRDLAHCLGKVSGIAFFLLLLSCHAYALVIDATFESTITGSSNAAQMESTIDTALSDISNLYSNAGTVNILFTTGSGGFLGESNTELYPVAYSSYTSLLQADSVANPSNTTLATAVANLAYGNDSEAIAATSALLRVGLGASSALPCFNASGLVVTSCGGSGSGNGVYDGIITLSSTQDLSYSLNGTNGYYYALRVIEHETDEILGGGGTGSTLNAVARNPNSSLAQLYGPLDLYRYSAYHIPSYTTSSSATSYLSVDGGATEIVGFNQNSNGDYGDFYSSGSCPLPANEDDVQAAFTCPTQQAFETTSSPEYQMMEALGYNPVSNTAVPEPASFAMLGVGIGAMLLARRRGAHYVRAAHS